MLNEYKRIDLYVLFTHIFKNLWIVAIAIIVFGSAAFIVTKFAISPKYNATIRLYANNKSEDTGSLTSSDLSASKSLVGTYIAIIKSNSFVEAIAEDTGLKYSAEQIKNMISAEAVNGTEVFDVSVTCGVPEDCSVIANDIAWLAPDKISDLIEGSSIKIVDRAKVPTQPTSPSLPKNIAIACFLGLVASCAALTVVYVYDTTIYNEKDIKEFYSLPILGIFPDFNEVSQGDSRYAYLSRGAEK